MCASDARGRRLMKLAVSHAPAEADLAGPDHEQKALQ
jgi:hypothetical protein